MYRHPAPVGNFLMKVDKLFDPHLKISRVMRNTVYPDYKALPKLVGNVNEE